MKLLCVPSVMEHGKQADWFYSRWNHLRYVSELIDDETGLDNFNLGHNFTS